MSSFSYANLVDRFTVVPKDKLKWLSTEDDFSGLLSTQSQQPENLGEYIWDPNDFYIEPKNDKKKPKEEKQILLVGKSEDKGEERKKNYKPGPFALFYELNEGTLNKRDQVWYYKEKKDIVGPVSSYDMDKLAFYQEVTDETRVAFKSIEKFVKLSKIKKILESEKKEQTE